ncbi:TnsA-like heteromeric transposase endonuclease subunit [Streptomyces sp. NPDC050704]|uniref:TnsA-like heteromeric transposase endonuclease subunit n=1 Tax=Streptomyces sp. NPDC050704 TaxID=3157219 RepID=UPI003416252A
MDAAGYRVTTIGPDGVRRDGPLSVMWPLRFEAGKPVRPFPSYRGQRNFTGWYWAATCGGHVAFESWQERNHLMRFDFDPDVIGMGSQPFALAWSDGQAGPVEHTPDFFVRRSDGTAVVVDVRPDELIDDRDVVKFTGTRAACTLVGWDYERVGALDPVFAANLHWLAGFRHARVMREETAALAAGVRAGRRVDGGRRGLW